MTDTLTAEAPEFTFYLDAWLFCHKGGIPLSAIRKVGISTYVVLP